MFKLWRIPLLCCLIFIYGCSKDREEIPGDDDAGPFELPAITVLGDAEGIEYQTNIPTSGDGLEVLNLTEEIGITQQIYVLEAQDDLVSFVTRAEGQTNAWQRNIRTEEVYAKQDYCPLETVASIFIASGSENYLTYLFDSLEDSENRYFLEVYDKNNDDCFRYDVGVERPSAVQDFGSVYGIYRAPSSEERELTLIDLEKRIPPKVLSLSNNFNFATVNERQLYLFFIDGSYEIYDIEDYTLTAEGSNEALTQTSAVGFLSTTFTDGQMVYYRLFPSPSSIAFTPEIYDFSTNRTTQPDLDLLAIKDDKERTLSKTIAFSDIQIDVRRNIVVIGYNEGLPSNKGGIVYADLEGTVLKSVSLSHTVRDLLIWE